MRVLVYDTHSYDRTFLEAANAGRHALEFTTAQLDSQTAALAQGFDAVCLFVNDRADAVVMARLAAGGVRCIAQRSTGYNNLDLAAAAQHGITCLRVGYYSPYAVAEFAVGLLQTLNRRIHRAWNRTREFNFRLAGLLGHDLHGRTVGVVGTGKIGAIFARIMLGFGCPVLATDMVEDATLVALGVRYVALDALLREAEILSLHVPLTPTTRHVLDAATLAITRPGVIIVNTSRGGLIDTAALVAAIESGHVGGVALDVYEEEEGKFFRDLSDTVMTDDVLARLLSFPNVLLTSHQAFFTHEAMTTIAETTIANLDDWAAGRRTDNVLSAPTT
ncbi:MAG: 2-hydroxyacid dehydrogenase [Gemmatimonadaceae bacterium]|jgi:D-lactate dehydrogenase|nr:2-hydroxyacid dehydrogenase [Gemmatimonadaceae bacterium]